MSKLPASVSKHQKRAFDTYILAHPKLAFLSRCSCDSEARKISNCILLRDDLVEVPLQWSEGGYTATQIIEGKRSLIVMRSQKLVLCQIEDARRRWFEAAVLGDDLSYPLGLQFIGLTSFPFFDYQSARRFYRQEVSRALRRCRGE